VGAVAAATEAVATERQPDSVATGPVFARARIGALAAPAVVATRVVVVVAQAEEPDQPHDQEAHVENAKADHEDPPLRGHASMLARPRGGEKAENAYFLCCG
jgi:hypothetical protein